MLAVEVADSSLGYDLGRKPQVYALHGVRELWVIDGVKRVVHIHLGLADGVYRNVETRSAAERLIPSVAPPEFAFALDELEDV